MGCQVLKLGGYPQHELTKTDEFASNVSSGDVDSRAAKHNFYRQVLEFLVAIPRKISKSLVG